MAEHRDRNDELQVKHCLLAPPGENPADCDFKGADESLSHTMRAPARSEPADALPISL